MDPVIDPTIGASAATNLSPEMLSGGTGPDLRFTLRLVASYFAADRWVGGGLVIVYILLAGGGSFFMLKAQENLADITNALAARQGGPVLGLAVIVLCLALVFLITSLITEWCQYIVRIRARRYYTDNSLAKWLTGNRFHSIERAGNLDYPEQRIQEDIYIFIEKVLALGPGMIASVVPMVLYSTKLWSLSLPIPLTAIGLPFNLHGAFFFAAGGFTLFWTYVTHILGRDLTASEVVRQNLEAEFRHDMASVRENSEAIAFERGSAHQAERLNGVFGLIRQNWRRYTVAQIKVRFCLNFPSMAFLVLPSLMCAPFILDGKMQVGDIQLVGASFNAVYLSVGVVIQMYAQLAILRSAAARLRYLDERLNAATPVGIGHSMTARPDIGVEGLSVFYPDGTMMVNVGDLAIRRGDRLLIKGKSGAGKSTLLRAIAGIWPFGRGDVVLPADSKVSFLPQRAYMPEGTLAGLMCYPSEPDPALDEWLAELLGLFGLSRLAPRLHEYAVWRNILSPGEQQRVAAARAIVNRPDYLFLDEATSALDSHSEANLYSLLDEHLPDAAIISIAHRRTVEQFHTKTIDVIDGGVRRYGNIS
ncbi:MAG TPA: ATP-binding cassette domain-containing protein [Sphingobium sp.]|uniref:ABC transporter ATP-binding protein/permease n=1 Tax=Sphingobium sp. TaxID=1912891 RepID=UPI002ED149FA